MNGNTKVRVGDAGTMGRGVFATRFIRRGEIACASPIVVIPDDQVDAIRGTLLSWYAFDHPAKDDLNDWTGCSVALGEASLVNHSGEPNATWEYGGDVLEIIALRDIVKGEEVTINCQRPAEMWAGENEGPEMSPPTSAKIVQRADGNSLLLVLTFAGWCEIDLKAFANFAVEHGFGWLRPGEKQQIEPRKKGVRHVGTMVRKSGSTHTAVAAGSVAGQRCGNRFA